MGVALSSLMLPIGANLDLLIVPQRLEVAGFDVRHATELFGQLKIEYYHLVKMKMDN